MNEINQTMRDTKHLKVPAVTFGFWILKILATTLGETGGDSLSMTLQLGYAISTGIFFAIFLVVIAAQIKASHFHPFLYWGVIVATTMVGTTMSDFLTRSAGLGYVWSSVVLFSCLIVTLLAWRFTLGSIAVTGITNPRAEAFYWVAILFSQTLGTALGDAFSDDAGLGYAGAALVFIGGLVLVTAGYFFTKISHANLFWAAFILTRPLGAALGDLLTKERDHGGLHLGRFLSSFVIAAVMIFLLFVFHRKAEKKAAQGG